jgi:hypothetical protein
VYKVFNINFLLRNLLILLLLTVASLLIVHSKAYADNGVSFSPTSFGLQKGSSTNYTVTFTNTSSMTVTKLTYAPGGTSDATVTAQSGCDSADLTDGSLTCNTSIPNNQSKTFTFTFAIPANSTSTAKYFPANAWSGDNGFADISPNVALFSVISYSPVDFTLVKGSSANYTVTYTNTSGSTVDKLTYGPTGTGDIRITAQSGCDSADLTDGNLTCNTSIANNQSKTFTLTLAIPSNGTNGNHKYIPANAWVGDSAIADISPFVNLLTNPFVLGINAGGDTQGNFVADTDYSGGSQYSTSSSVDTSGVTNPAPDAVYQSVRYGNETYTIPNLTANTNYTVRLHFNELYWNSAGSRVFNVSLNGSQVLHNFDILKTAGGENKALVEQFNAISDSNGEIAIALSTVTDNAMVNGIEIDSSTVPTHSLSGTVYNDTNRNGVQDTGESGYSGATVTLSNGQTTTTDSNGNYTFSNLPQEDTYTATVTLPNDYVATTTNPVKFSLNADTTENFGIAPFQSLSINAGGSSASSFVSDVDFSGGTPYSSSASVDTTGVTNPAPQSVYQTVRYGNFSYTVPNLSTSHTYTVRLHFNELYWNSAGSRVFNVDINGTQVLSNYDIFQDAGGENKAVVKEYTATPDSNGNITTTFSTVTDNAMVNGIEVIQQ